MDTRIHDYTESGSHEYWTEQEYNTIVEHLEPVVLEVNPAIEEEVDEDNLFTEFELDNEENANQAGTDSGEENSDEEIIESRGVKSVCPLNVLSSFHCITSFPPDILHDVMEGVIPEDLLSIIRILSLKGWFTISEYNILLERLGFTSHESNDKPYPVPESKKVKKLKGKAVSNWVHLRNWPLVIKDFVVNSMDPVLCLGLNLHEIIMRMTATEFLSHEIDILGKPSLKATNCNQ